jgi:predicted metalloendopeptidase
MRTLFAPTRRFAAVCSVVAVSLLPAFAGTVFAGDSSGRKPELGTWGVDLTTRDTGVKPGDDFYRYANGQWLDTFEIPADLPAYGSFTILTLRAEDQIKGIIQEQPRARGGIETNGERIAELYAGFMDENALNARGLTPLDPYFKKIAAAKSHEDIAVLMAELNRVNGGGTSLFAVFIDQDEKAPTRYIPHFVQSGLGLPNRDYYLKNDNERFMNARQAYRDYLEKLFTMAGKSEPGARADRIIAAETEVARAHWPVEETRDLDKTYNKTSRQDLKKLAPDFPWDAYLNALGMKAQNQFIVMEPSAYTDMATVFKQTPVEVWQDYLVQRLLRSNSALMTKELDDATFEFTSAAITGAKQQRERWKRGVQLVNGTMGMAVGKMYVDRYFTPEAKQSIDELVANLLVAMGQRIDGLTWMSDATKQAAHQKLSKFTVKIGYPEKWRDYSRLKIAKGDLVGNVFRARTFEYDYQLAKLAKPVDRKEWLMSPQTVNAYYNPSMNEIVFPAAILQPPFFDPYADDAVNYGAIGAVIGHEIGHGFDDQGRKSDGDGVLRDWWTAEDAARFKERADSLVARYNGFTPLPGMHVNGENTLGENIGDLGGLEIAHHAYLLSLGGKEPPVIDGLTGEQRFFLGFAQMWRAKMREAMLTSMVASNEHSPAEFRVTGPVPNMDAWYDAFNVTPEDSLYLPPDRRIHIW